MPDRASARLQGIHVSALIIFVVAFAFFFIILRVCSYRAALLFETLIIAVIPILIKLATVIIAFTNLP
jgi:hypothetical protein